MALFPSTLNAVTSKLLLSNSVKLCHSSAGKLRIPPNLAEEAETQKIKFSPHRQRDTSAAHIAAKLNKTATGQVFRRGLDSSACRSVGSTFNAGSTPKDRRAPVYDQTNACSLSSVMQTNVPQPVKSDGRGERSGHLSMPGGQWSQNDKYISSDLHEHHYQKNSLSSKTKSQKKKTPSSSEVLPERGGSAQFECCFARLQSVSASNIAVSAAYANTVLDPAAYPLMLGECIVHSPMPGIPSVSVPVHHLDLSIPSSSAGYHRLCVRMPHRPLMFKFLSLSSPSVIQCHEFSSSSVTRNKDSTGTNLEANAPETSEQVLTSGQKIKRAVKEYGTAVIVFHVTISLASLGFFYLLVSSGVDMGGLIQRLGIDLSEAAVAPEASLQLPAGGVGDAANVSDAGGSSGAEGASVAFGAEQSLNTSDSNKIRDGKLSTTGNIAAGVSTFVVAYAIHKVFAPLRVGITLSVVPFVVRYYRRTWKKR